MEIEKIRRKWETAYVQHVKFDKAKETLEKEGYKIPSLEEMAELKMQKGQGSFISRYNTLTIEGFIHIQGKGVFLTKNSPIVKYAKRATKCHMRGYEFCLDPEQVEEALANSYKITESTIRIPVLKLADEGLTAFAFGKYAMNYGKFLDKSGIKTFEVRVLPPINEKPSVTQAQFFGEGSELDGGGAALYQGLCNVGVLGMRKTKPRSLQIIRGPTIDDIIGISDDFVAPASMYEFHERLEKFYK